MTRRGLMFPLVLYFGAKQGPGIFQRVMDQTFGHIRDADGEIFHAIFIDDVTIATEAWDGDTDDAIVERHILHCEAFLTAALERHVSFKLTKCKWAQLRGKLLGFIVGQGEKRVDPAKAQGLRDWPDPKTLEDIDSFRAYANFIKEYIPNYVQLDAGLRPHGKKGATFEGYLADANAVKSFNDIRTGLIEAATLNMADYAAAADRQSGRPLLLFVDASDYGWGCTLAQVPADGLSPKPIAVFSRSFTATEQAWSAFERELFGMRES